MTEINVDDLNSTDTKKLIEAQKLVTDEIIELREVLVEIKEVLVESKDLLVEIKEALSGA